MILVDSSVWVSYFRTGDNSDLLQTFISLDLVCTNEIILSELLPALKRNSQHEIVESLEALPCIPYTIFWEGIRELQLLNLQKGINKVGLPDLMIAQHCLNDNIELLSLDKHFRLMAAHTSLKVITP